MKTKRASRVLVKILSRHRMRGLPCKIPEQIYYSESLKQQGKIGIKHASRHENKEWQEIKSQSTSGLRMHTHRN